jgi:SAM-dependent methyltransferase
VTGAERTTGIDADRIRAGKALVVERFGPWQADNIHLGDGVFTVTERVLGNEIRAAFVLQVAQDIMGGPLEGRRILDLGAAEGLFAVEMALQGAEVVAVEGRQAHVEKARFAKDALDLANLEVVCDDVRNLSRERYGEFDLVLCLGILYHLDAPDVLKLVDEVAGVCRRALIIDTHYSLHPKVEIEYAGRSYWGRRYVEHDPSSSPAEREMELRASLDNPQSFWLTRPSLWNLLSHAGFSSVFEVRVPRPARLRDRVMLVAVRGPKSKVLSAPQISDWPVYEWPEKEEVEPVLIQAGILRRAAHRLLPARLRRSLGRLRRSRRVIAPKDL